ncbi:pantothenate kinase [Mesorhizobium sp. J18]|uniref:nucleoside triphosphate hydrolase n=1 Tax=Mesorhizobium sp. J18 TaxID=935263 RepID=UPI00119BBEDA|nr:nucleoside triphosphate hydrolase [Mesorhizobium sp. J18]TWG92482.1 pantothenate kinase [Mesorhizobium sp. J18]
MSEIGHIAAEIFRRGHSARRMVVAIAGPPGSGKTTLAASIRDAVAGGGQTAAVLGLDGFHFDDALLEARGWRSRKGAPHTFDFAGFRHLLRRIRSVEDEIAIPVFDRNIEIARSAADVIGADTRIVLVEGNYLLLDDSPWDSLEELFDVTVFLDVPRDELERRLLQRWREHGKSEAEGRVWVSSNDMSNVDLVLAKRRPADIVI